MYGAIITSMNGKTEIYSNENVIIEDFVPVDGDIIIDKPMEFHRDMYFNNVKFRKNGKIIGNGYVIFAQTFEL